MSIKKKQINEYFANCWQPGGNLHYTSVNHILSLIGPKDEVLDVGCGYNPNRDRLIAALEEMVNNPESVANIEANVGQYEWVIGDEANALRDNLMTFITEDTLQDLVQFNTEALGLASVYKPELAQ